jgi:glucose-1-phosphate cytidylyltransferase
MKVVLFCGGLGTRMRGQFQDQPKPLVNVGPHSLVWNVMRYYAHHGHTDFILCLGYGAAAFTRYFEEKGAEIIPTISSGGPCQCFRLPDDDNGHWDVTLVDTGMHTSIGQRLRAVRGHVGEDEMFLANYADGLTDLPLQTMIDLVVDRPETVGALVAVRPVHSFHYIRHDAEGVVTNIESSVDIDVRINGGYFVFRREIFDFIEEGDDLVERPFERLIAEARLLARPHDGFWRACDTLKDVQFLSDMQQKGTAPWEIWRKDGDVAAAPLPPVMISPAA